MKIPHAELGDASKPKGRREFYKRPIMFLLLPSLLTEALLFGTTSWMLSAPMWLNIEDFTVLLVRGSPSSPKDTARSSIRTNYDPWSGEMLR